MRLRRWLRSGNPGLALRKNRARLGIETHVAWAQRGRQFVRGGARPIHVVRRRIQPKADALILASFIGAHERFEIREDGSIIVIPDSSLPSGRLVEIIDLAKEAGAIDIAIATRSKEATAI